MDVRKTEDRYGHRWLALSNTTLGVLMALVNSSIVLISLPAIFRGIRLDPLQPANVSYLLWMLMGWERGAASGMRATFQNAGMVLSMGLFFSILLVGLAAGEPRALRAGLLAHHVPAAAAERIAGLPPVGTLFAAFLGENPVRELLGPRLLRALPPQDAAALTGKTFFPSVLSAPFHDGLVLVFGMALALSVLAALASSLRGKERARAERLRVVPAGRPAEA